MNNYNHKYDYNETGTWCVHEEHGEGGDTRGPLLGYFSGTYENIYAHVSTLPNWFSYGAGGKIEKITIKVVNDASVIRRAKLLREEASLEASLKTVRESINASN